MPPQKRKEATLKRFRTSTQIPPASLDNGLTCVFLIMALVGKIENTFPLTHFNHCFKNVGSKTGDMVQQLRVLTALAEGLSLVPSNHIGQLSTT